MPVVRSTIGNADFLRAAARAVVALAGDAHQSAHGLHGKVIGGDIAFRAGLAKSRDGAIDEPRIDLAQALVIEPELSAACRP
jgi:hypothetical protein